VLPIVRRAFPEWTAFLTQTERLYISPLPDDEAVELLPAYTVEVARFVQTLADRVPS